MKKLVLNRRTLLRGMMGGSLVALGSAVSAGAVSAGAVSATVVSVDWLDSVATDSVGAAPENAFQDASNRQRSPNRRYFSSPVNRQAAHADCGGEMTPAPSPTRSASLRQLISLGNVQSPRASCLP